MILWQVNPLAVSFDWPNRIRKSLVGIINVQWQNGPLIVELQLVCAITTLSSRAKWPQKCSSRPFSVSMKSLCKHFCAIKGLDWKQNILKTEKAERLTIRGRVLIARKKILYLTMCCKMLYCAKHQSTMNATRIQITITCRLCKELEVGSWRYTERMYLL